MSVQASPDPMRQSCSASSRWRRAWPSLMRLRVRRRPRASGCPPCRRAGRLLRTPARASRSPLCVLRDAAPVDPHAPGVAARRRGSPRVHASVSMRATHATSRSSCASAHAASARAAHSRAETPPQGASPALGQASGARDDGDGRGASAAASLHRTDRRKRRRRRDGRGERWNRRRARWIARAEAPAVGERRTGHERNDSAQGLTRGANGVLSSGPRMSSSNSVHRRDPRVRPLRSRARPAPRRRRASPHRAYDPVAESVPEELRADRCEIWSPARFVVVAVPVPRIRSALVDLRPTSGRSRSSSTSAA